MIKEKLNYFKYLAIYLFILTINLSLNNRAFAHINTPDPTTFNVGDASRNMTAALNNITDLVLSMAAIVGVGFFFAALAKFQQHRRNPQQVPLSHFFAMLFMSLALILIKFILVYGDSAYNIMKAEL